MMPEEDTYYLLPPARQKMGDLVEKIDTLTRDLFNTDCCDSLRYISTFLPDEMTHIIYLYLDIHNPFTDTRWLRYYGFTLWPEKLLSPSYAAYL